VGTASINEPSTATRLPSSAEQIADWIEKTLERKRLRALLQGDEMARHHNSSKIG